MKVYFILLLLLSASTFAQVVPARDEPRHKPVIVNEYFRVLDVNIPPGDTTLYHVHETPSLFAYRVTSMANGKLNFERRGPIIAALVEGERVILTTEGAKETTVIYTGKPAYLPPGKSYELSAGSGNTINLVLFELK